MLFRIQGKDYTSGIINMTIYKIGDVKDVYKFKGISIDTGREEVSRRSLVERYSER